MNWWVVLIIVLALGMILGNILLVKYTANMKMPKPKHDNNKNWDDDEED